ncbi:CDP-diacylglycerol--glycerol-3-phosphate 3-phosphatidyltransferase [Thermodesulfobacteriota bacterium]
MKNLPNQLTIARIVMIFLFMILCNIDEKLPMEIQQTWRVAAFIFVILAGLTDFFDGFIARKYNLVTDFGKLMDPLADKIFIAATFIMLVDKSLLAGWIAVVVLSREFLVTGLRLLAVSKGEVISADITGKMKTLSQMLFLFLAGFIWVGWLELDNVKILWNIFTWIVVILTIWSGMGYFIRHKDLYLSNT